MDLIATPTNFEDMDYDVKCPSCEWTGKVSNCPVEWEQDGWENPEYTISICPKCGEPIEV